MLVNNPTTYGLRFTSHRMEAPAGTIPEEWKPGAPVTAQFFAAPPPKQSRARDRSGGEVVSSPFFSQEQDLDRYHHHRRQQLLEEAPYMECNDRWWPTQHYYGLMVEAGFDDVTCTTTPFAPTAGTAEEDAEEENGEDPEGGSVRSSSGSGSGSGSSSSSSSGSGSSSTTSS